ncbi:MAG TPA: hypothetical protein VN238_04745, partial [Solirubrobacteraceae bacterium]|nr:hypothetical protein [Solirubrobacteraceae bacterium]
MDRTPQPRPDEDAPKRILILAMHPGYIRNYERTIRYLLDAGHEIHIAFSNKSKQSADRVAERLTHEYVNLWLERAPKSPRTAVENLRRLLRLLGDYARYQHPRYVDAVALRDRAGAKLLHLRRGSGPIPALFMTLYVPTLGRISHATYADRVSRMALRLADALPAPARPVGWMAEHHPDIFLTTPHLAIGSNEPEFLDAARALGVPSGLLVASWDNLTNKGLIKSPTDMVVVWNEAQRTEAVELHDVPPERVVVTGAQRFDDWFEMSASTEPAEFKRRVGLDPERPYILYLCSSPFIAPEEVPFVFRFIETLRASDGSLKDAGVLVRPHPQNADQWMAADVSDFDNVVIWPRAGEQPVRASSKAGFYDSMHHSAAVVGINTSAQIEAGILGRTVHTVLDPAFKHTQEGTLHFKHLLVEHGGLLFIASDLDELVRNLERVQSGELDAGHARRFVESFIRPHGLDREASPIVADAIEELARLPETAVETPRLRPLERTVLRLLTFLSISSQPGLLARDLRDGFWAFARRLRATTAGRAIARVLRRPELIETGPVAVKPGRRNGKALPGAPPDGPYTVVIEPWTDDLASELLLWIPLLRYKRRRWGPDAQLVILSDGAPAEWFSTLGPREVLELGSLGIAGRRWERHDRHTVVTELKRRQPAQEILFYGTDEGEHLLRGARAGSTSLVAVDKRLESRRLLTRAAARREAASD